MATHALTFPGADGTPLAGILATPEASSPISSLCVILVHGGMSHKNSFYHKHVASKLVADLGISVFRYDRNNNGQSESSPGPGTRNFMGSFWEDVDDLGAAIEYLRTEKRLTTCCLIGHSAAFQVIAQFAVKRCVDRGRAPPPLLVNVHSRFDLSFWYDEWRRKTTSKGDGGEGGGSGGGGGEWLLTWKSYGKTKEHRVSLADAKTYSSVSMANVVRLNDAADVDVLSVYGFVPADNLSGKLGYLSASMTCDGVVPLSDVPQFGNLLRRHHLTLLDNVGHYYKEPGAHDKLWAALEPWLRPRIRALAAGPAGLAGQTTRNAHTSRL